MQASVIIPTYNGAKKLPNLLLALERQTIDDFEVIIIADGSTDSTSQLMEAYEGPLHITFVQQQNRGRSVTRNRGVALAKAPLLIFFDDDMRPLPDCIAQHIAHHTQFPGSIVTGGLKEEVTEDSKELFRYKSFLSDKWLAPLKSAASTLLNNSQIFVTTANFSVSKHIFTTIGGFDERLTDAEDYDFAVRAHLLNIPLYFKDSAFAWHDDAITTASYIRRQRQYAAAQKKLLQIHPDWLQQGFLKMPYQPRGAKAFFFRLFCNRLWIYALDRQWFGWLAKPVRYRLYDYIITANGVFFPKVVSL